MMVVALLAVWGSQAQQQPTWLIQSVAQGPDTAKQRVVEPDVAVQSYENYDIVYISHIDQKANAIVLLAIKVWQEDGQTKTEQIARTALVRDKGRVIGTTVAVDGILVCVDWEELSDESGVHEVWQACWEKPLANDAAPKVAPWRWSTEGVIAGQASGAGWEEFGFNFDNAFTPHGAAFVVIATDKAAVDYEVNGTKGTVAAGKSAEVAVQPGQTVKVTAQGDTTVTLTFLDQARLKISRVKKDLQQGGSHSEKAPGSLEKILYAVWTEDYSKLVAAKYAGGNVQACGEFPALPISEAPNRYPTVYVDKDGGVWVAVGDVSYPPGPNVWVYYSSDQCASWKGPVDMTPTGLYSDMGGIVRLGDKIYAVYDEDEGAAPGTADINVTTCAVAKDSEGKVIGVDPATCVRGIVHREGGFPHIATDGTGLYVASQDSNANEVKFSYSCDAGGTWTPKHISNKWNSGYRDPDFGAVLSRFKVAVDHFVYVVWFWRSEGKSNIMLGILPNPCDP
jgi:hypothetical protein